MRLPRNVARTVNRRAHELALTYEVSVRADLLEEAERLLAAGMRAEVVAAILSAHQAPARDLKP